MYICIVSTKPVGSVGGDLRIAKKKYIYIIYITNKQHFPHIVLLSYNLWFGDTYLSNTAKQ